jgi:hypothetical protein
MTFDLYIDDCEKTTVMYKQPAKKERITFFMYEVFITKQVAFAGGLFGKSIS